MWPLRCWLLPWLCASALAGCGSTEHDAQRAESVPITALVGQISLHQFPLGGHAWAGFLATPVPLEEVHGDQIIQYEYPRTATVGSCALFVQPRCQPECAGASHCTGPDRCTPLERVTWVDAGEVRVTGSRIVPTIRMWYGGPASVYEADPMPGSALLFQGGERLQIRGGTGAFAHAGTVAAPPPVVVTAPDLSRDLHLPRDEALEVTWVGEGGAAIVVLITASTADRGSSYIRCVTADIGSLTVPRAIIAGLPAPPRSTRFEVERDEERIFRTARPGIGVLVHAAQSTWKNGGD
ncbi:MAG: hypothetical protein EXR72_15740 [Myxococcales bacterium]|nr:hypothetical protein [Myxococcales bacterium]